MFKGKFQTVGLSSLAALLLCAVPAAANHLTNVSVISANCNGFTITGTGAWLNLTNPPSRTLAFNLAVNGTPIYGQTAVFPTPPNDGAYFNNPPNPPSYSGQYTSNITQTFSWSQFGFTPPSNGTLHITGNAFVGNDESGDTSNVPLPVNFSTSVNCAPPTPKIALTKQALASSAGPFEPVTYQYTVTNTGGETLYNITLTDDNGSNNPLVTGGSNAPSNGYVYHAADVTIGTIASLAPGAYKTFTKQLYPAITMCDCISTSGSGHSSPGGPGGKPGGPGGPGNNQCSNPTTPIGTLLTQRLSNGNLGITYLQSLAIVDNTYGTNASSGWGSHGHTFNDLLGSDGAVFDVTGNGSTVWEAEIDYVSQAKSTSITFPGGGSASYPSGYGTLGYGGDGKFISGLQDDLVFTSTTITTDLNQSPAYYGYTTSSPSPSDPNWNPVDGYYVELANIPSTFSVTIPYVHNSPSKIQGTIKFFPKYCPNPSQNTATVTAYSGPNNTGTKLTGSATSTVTMQ